MELIDMKKIVIERLRALPVCIINSANTQFTVRCPFCGDSHDRTHGHLSIKVDMNSDSILLYRCFRCNESGIVNSELMSSIGAYLSEGEEKLLDTVNRPNSKSTYSRQKPLKYKVPLVMSNGNNYEKLEYLTSRLGIKFTRDMIKESKIILSILDFFTENDIEFPKHISQKLIMMVERYYVGFLSSNNNKITFRRINDNLKLNRYIKLTIDPYNSSANNFYSMNNQSIDLLYTEPVHIHMAEGTFDIVGVRYNIERDESTKDLFFASCGYNYLSIIKWLIYMGVNTDLNIHIYSDNDKDDKDIINKIRTPLTDCWIDHLYIHRNMYENEKDFGVPKERIHNAFKRIK